MTRVSLLVVCTGNAARSVMAGLMLERLGTMRGMEITVSSAGTHAVEGLPLSARTLSALRAVPGLAATPDEGWSPIRAHRSHQLCAEDLRDVDLVVVMEAGHVRHVRRSHPEASGRTAVLRRLVRELPSGSAPLPARVAALDLGHTRLDAADDVTDPAGLGDEAYGACAVELWALCQELVPRL